MTKPWELPPDRRSRLARAGEEFDRALPAGSAGGRAPLLDYALTNLVADEEAALLSEHLRLQRARISGESAHRHAEHYPPPLQLYQETSGDKLPLSADLQVMRNTGLHAQSEK